MAAKAGTGSVRKVIRALRLQAEAKAAPAALRDKMLRAENELNKVARDVRDGMRSLADQLRELQYRGFK